MCRGVHSLAISEHYANRLVLEECKSVAAVASSDDGVGEPLAMLESAANWLILISVIVFVQV